MFGAAGFWLLIDLSLCCIATLATELSGADIVSTAGRLLAIVPPDCGGTLTTKLSRVDRVCSAIKL